MGKLGIGSAVTALPGSDTWMNQIQAVGFITEVFCKDGKDFAKVSVPKWLIKRNYGGHIINEWLRKGWSKPTDDSLLLDEGIELAHLKLSEMPEQTMDEKVDSLIDLAFGVGGDRLGINVVYYPKDLIITPGICVHQNCDQPRTHLCWHNCWGTAQAFMVCEPHYRKLNGRCSDGFPLKTERLCEVA